MCEKIFECIDKFAPEKEVVNKNQTNSSITNEIENAIVKLDCLFRKWVGNSYSKNYIQQKKSTEWNDPKKRLAKKEANFKKLGPDPDCA